MHHKSRRKDIMPLAETPTYFQFKQVGEIAILIRLKLIQQRFFEGIGSGPVYRAKRKVEF